MRRKPKKAVVIAAHIMTLSSKSLEELNRLLWMILSREGVMGRRLGSEWDLPWARLMPLSSRYSLSKSRKGANSPWMMHWCLMAHRCTLTLEWELKEAMWVAKSTKVSSSGG